MSFPTRTILIVSSDNGIKGKLTDYFTSFGYTINCASTSQHAIEIVNSEFPNLIIIDIILPKQDGFELCREIRAKSTIPIILLSPFTSASDRIVGFEVGADDYITKPFSPKELEIRVCNILKRLTDTNESLRTPIKPKFSFGSLIIDLERKSISNNNVKIKLTTLEFNILQLLVTNTGSVLSRADILNNVWGYVPERTIDLRVVDVHISRLRAKLETDSKSPEYILTIRGGGYMFKNYS